MDRRNLLLLSGAALFAADGAAVARAAPDRGVIRAPWPQRRHHALHARRLVLRAAADPAGDPAHQRIRPAASSPSPAAYPRR